MTKPRHATTSRAGKRFYSWRNEQYWSVTTILSGGIPKPALINWAKLYTANYAVDNFKALTALVESGDRDGAIDWLKGAAFRDRDRKADLGSLVHSAAEAYSLGKPFPKWPLEAIPRMNAYVRFLTDYEPTFEATEASVYNRTQRYAGTLDAIATINGRKLLLDTKTGKGVYPEVALQLAAYRHAEFIGLPDGDERDMHTTDGAVCLHLSDGDDGKGDYQLIEVDAGEETFTYFLYVREVFRWQEEKAKQVLLGPYPSTLEAAGMDAPVSTVDGAPEPTRPDKDTGEQEPSAAGTAAAPTLFQPWRYADPEVN